jgi:hypothetical protein
MHQIFGPRVTRITRAVSPSLHGREDELDWLENQRRSANDVQQVEATFWGASLLMSLLWLVMGGGAVGGVLALGSYLAAR